MRSPPTTLARSAQRRRQGSSPETREPIPRDRPGRSAPAIDETNGLVFFARSGFGCGKGVTFYQLHVGSLGATPTKIGTLPDGIDLDGAASLALNPDTNYYDYFFARVKCSNGATDIFALRSVSPG